MGTSLTNTIALGFTLLLLACGGASPDGDSGTADTGARDTAPATDTGTTIDANVPETCGTDSALGLAACVEGDRYQEDLVFIAAERTPASAHWQAVQDRCAERFTSLGYTVERHAYGTGVNVIGVKAGTGEADRRVLVGAHYDHIAGCAGADDNATGTAATLEVARVLALGSFPRTLVVACWDEEERGLIGSTAYADRASGAGEDIVIYYNFEMIGFVDPAPDTQSIPTGLDLLFPNAIRAIDARERRGDFLAVIGDESAAAAISSLERHGAALGLATVSIAVPTGLVSEPLLGDLQRSDHAPFWDRGYPAILLTDTSEFRYEGYHCTSGQDSVERLNQEFSTRVVQTTVAAAAQSLGL